VQDRVLKAVVFSSVEFLFLFGLWMLFVSQTPRAELVAGIFAAAIGAVADGVVKAKRLAKFRPRPRWLWLFSWEPWYVLTGSAAIMWALARRLMGKRSEAQFRAVPFRAGGNDPESAARRALAITLTTVSPETIVVGIDRERDLMLLHLIAPASTPKIARPLGAQS
jgi:multisubunit Na+/H+ antiporter MnhE subunit